MSRTLRYLRIAWTAFFGIVAVLLIVLWVQSYWCGFIVSFVGSPELILTKGQLLYDVVYVYHDRLSVTEHTLEFGQDIQLVITQVWFSGNNGIEIYDYQMRLQIILTVVCALAATVLPWLAFVPRRFSLRTLLITTTLVAIALGTIVFATRN